MAQASAETDAALTVMQQDIREILRKGREGESFTQLERAKFRRDKAFTVQLCQQAVTRLFDISGGHGISIQRRCNASTATLRPWPTATGW